ncbi:DUF885 family protein [Amycolatopsis sp. NPDC049688]|uniref:DUF885 family protein n=1 Tax=Amycolatopsis sp. NPDC049688 TaxID=3154733 RepID=UPI0034308D5B
MIVRTSARAGLPALAKEFWTWRLATQPDSYDDITRVERPPGWTPDWSPAAIAARRVALSGFAERYRAVDVSDEDIPVQVDHRLLGSALARAHWELDLLRGWQRNPGFYVDQALVPVYNLLLAPAPFDAERAHTLIALLRRVPSTLSQAVMNLGGETVESFADHALGLLAHADQDVVTAMSALAPHLPEECHADLSAATGAARTAVVAYRDWLRRHRAGFRGAVSIGPGAFGYFLHRVALLPYPATQLLAMGRQEWQRAVATETLLRHRYRHSRPPELPDLPTLVAREDAAEQAVRRFLAGERILGQPTGLRRYRFAPMPAYLAPLTWLGVPHYASGQSRSGEDALRYVTDPGPDLPYFPLADARDPRCGIIHEGVHAQQLALSWRHPDPIRRHYYDSTPNEGVAFYNEELMLQSGLLDDEPTSALFVANAMRLRALRVEVDIGLAVGDLTLAQAADQLAERVPMDRATALAEAAFFAGNPGQGLSYQIGKLQILALLNDCVREQGSAFDLMAFHDRLWLEGNVPLALQRWELLGLRDEVDTADRLAA